jgi:pimeloyl-ACP methyl ester carboxylesterase
MESLHLDTPDAHLRYLDYPGDKTPIVFIHGLGCASTFDYPIVASDARLAGHRKLAVDLFGHGYSDAPRDFTYTVAEHARTVAELLDHLGIKGAVLYGHSMGGSAAVMLTVARPDLVSRLLLAEPNLKPGGGFLSRYIAEQSEEEFVAHGHHAVVEKFIDWPLRIATFRGTDSVGFYRSSVSLVAGTSPTWREQLYAIQVPRTYVAGEKSNPTTEELEEFTSRGIRVCVVPRGGHDMAVENPEGVAEAIAQALSA